MTTTQPKGYLRPERNFALTASLTLNGEDTTGKWRIGWLKMM